MLKIRINSRVVIIGLFFLILYLLLGYIYTTNSMNSMKQTKYQEVATTMKQELLTLIKEKEEAILLIGISLSQNKNLVDFLKNKKNKPVELERYSKALRENTSLKNIWFQIIDTQGISLYRSWSSKRGDSLVKARVDVKKIIENPKIISSMSTGKFDMTFKTMIPIYEGKSFLGVVETIAKFNSIVVKMQEKNFKTLLLAAPNYKKQLTKAFTKTFIDDYYVASLRTDKQLLNIVQNDSPQKFLLIDKYMVDKRNSLLITLYKLPDINGNDMGYFIMAKNLDEIDMKDMLQTRDRILLGLFLGFIIITGFLYYLYIVNYRNFMEKQKTLLQEQVNLQTNTLKAQSEELRHIAHHDALTDLPNRLLFMDRLKQAVKHAKRKKLNMCVLFLDLDRFKEINDTYGHEMGDKLLQETTKRVRKSMREDDTIARLGGDEFTIILQNVTQENAVKVAETIIENMQKAFVIQNTEMFVTFSIGISSYPQDGESANILLRNADTAMYRAKERGKNNYQFYNASMTEMALQRSELQKSIKQALKNDEFEPYYQPKIDATTSKVVGLEALVRWNHPTKGLVSPAFFIPFAEEVGLIVDIDSQTMDKALKQAKTWLNEGLNIGRLSLNISAKQLESKKAINQFEEAIKQVDFDTKYLEFEITESQIMLKPKKAMEILQYIKSIGIKISLDDFGTGYSSLSYLKNLPVDNLKIDRSFVVDATTNKEDEAIIKIIISLAKNLDLDVIAEGVETKEQVEFLLEHGCNTIQGFYYAKPLSAEDCEAFLIANR